MRTFSTLTARGQALRLRHMALVALKQYKLHIKNVRLVTNHLNAIFRVDTNDGQIYALRISHPTWRTNDDLQAELHWLQALAHDTTIDIPKLFPNNQGNLITPISIDGVPEKRRAVLMSWLHGRTLAEQLSESNLYRFGILTAQLHEHAATWLLPSDLKVCIKNNIYVRGEPDKLFCETNRDLFTDHSRVLFERVHGQIQTAFELLYSDQQGLHIIHGDLHQENVKVFRGRLQPLDFEDVIMGYPVQDIAQTFSDLLFYSSLDNSEYQLLRDAFMRGYSSYRPWPEAYAGQIDTFIAGQQLWRTNYVVRFERQYASSFIAWLTQLFQAFLETGILLK